MPNYLYKCKCGNEFHEVRKLDDADHAWCDGCGGDAERAFEGTTHFKYEHRTNFEKAIHRDLVEANNLERESATNPVRRSNSEQAKIEREVRKLKFTD